jgi:hypothetical protein
MPARSIRVARTVAFYIREGFRREPVTMFYVYFSLTTSLALSYKVYSLRTELAQIRWIVSLAASAAGAGHKSNIDIDGTFTKIAGGQEQDQRLREFLVKNGWGDALEALARADVDEGGNRR